MRVDFADAAVAAAMLDRLVSLRHELAAKPATAAPKRIAGPSVDDRARRLSTQLDRAARLAVEGEITAAELRAQRERIDREMADLAAQREAAARAVRAAKPESRRAALAQIETLTKAWSRLDNPARRTVLRQLASRVTIAPHEAPAIEWRGAEELAEEPGHGIKEP